MLGIPSRRVLGSGSAEGLSLLWLPSLKVWNFRSWDGVPDPHGLLPVFFLPFRGNTWDDGRQPREWGLLQAWERGGSSGLLEEHLTGIPSPSKVHGSGGSSLGNSVKLLSSFLIKKL